MQLTINGEQREITLGSSIESLLKDKNLKAQMVVVEHNGLIVPRNLYSETRLQDGDTLEIVQMMAGG